MLEAVQQRPPRQKISVEKHVSLELPLLLKGKKRFGKEELRSTKVKNKVGRGVEWPKPKTQRKI
jgi:hypothetical protein